MKTPLRSLVGRPQPLWLVLSIGVIALLIIARIVLLASQICDMINLTYAAGAT